MVSGLTPRGYPDSCSNHERRTVLASRHNAISKACVDTDRLRLCRPCWCRLLCTTCGSRVGVGWWQHHQSMQDILGSPPHKNVVFIILKVAYQRIFSSDSLWFRRCAVGVKCCGITGILCPPPCCLFNSSCAACKS